jgi:hypothetical protein
MRNQCMWKIVIIEATQRDRFQAKTSVNKEKQKKRLAIRDPLESFGIAKQYSPSSFHALFSSSAS